MPITERLPKHHKHCDERFADAEAAALSADWQTAAAAVEHFVSEMEGHFAAEEEALFPAFEAATGTSGGPTQVMRMEHAQMRQLLSALTTSTAARDRDAFAGAAETLLVLMQQHNLKEEHILYPMCERALAGSAFSIDAELGKRIPASCPA